MISRNTIRRYFPNEVAERTTPTIGLTLLDQDGAGVSAGVLTALSLTLFNERTGALVNDRNHTNVLNTGIGTVSEAGAVTLVLTAEDTAIVDASRATELRVALIEWAWTHAGVPKAGKAELAFVVRNLHHVPSA